MKTTINLLLRAFPVTIRDQRTGVQRADTIVLDKLRLQAAQLAGESSKELIHRFYNRQGYKVLEIGKPIKQELTLDLLTLYAMSSPGGLDVTEDVRRFLADYAGTDAPDNLYSLVLYENGTMALYEDTNAGGGDVLNTARPGGNHSAE